VALELYNSSQNLTRDNPVARSSTPSYRVNGKVYVGAQIRFIVYESVLRSTPVIAPNGGVFTNLVTVSISGLGHAWRGRLLLYARWDDADDEIRFVYVGPFVITNSTVVQL